MNMTRKSITRQTNSESSSESDLTYNHIVKSDNNTPKTMNDNETPKNTTSSSNSNIDYSNNNTLDNNLIHTNLSETNLCIKKKTSSKKNKHKLTKQERAERYLSDGDQIIQCSTRGMLVVAFIFIIAAIASMYFNGPQRILSAAIGKIFRLEQGTDFYENWMNPDEPMKFNIYVFNLTNEKEFMAGDEKANLQEIGPYVYTLKVGRTIHAMNKKNMTYTNNRNFMFRPELSNGLDASTDLINHINLPKLLMKASGALVNGIFDFLAEVEIFSDAAELVDQHTVHEYLWGYDYDMLEVVQSFDETKSSKFGMMEDQNGTVSQETLLPEPLSYFAPKYTVLTGQTNPSDLLKLVSFNGEKHLGCWKNSESGKLGNVTDIEQVSPGKVNAEFVEVFREEAFRTTKLFYEGDKEIPHGENWPIPVRRYEQRRESLDGKGYCANGKLKLFFFHVD